MYTYDKPLRETHHFAVAALTAATPPAAIRRPPGMRFARISEYTSYNSSATTSPGTTTSARVNIGDGVTPAKFAALKIGPDVTGFVSGISYGMRDNDGRVAAYKHKIDMDTAGPGGAALSELDVTFALPVGGTLAGGPLNTAVVVDWWA